MWSLVFKLFRRDWRSGELKVLIAALIVAVSAVSSINFFSSRVEIAMEEETSRFIGADLCQRIKELERQLEDEQIRSFGYNRMIDIAEKQLNITIRKKPDTKQSKK